MGRVLVFNSECQNVYIHIYLNSNSRSAILDSVRVIGKDTESSIEELGQVSVKDAQTLVVNCFDPEVKQILV